MLWPGALIEEAMWIVSAYIRQAFVENLNLSSMVYFPVLRIIVTFALLWYA